MAKLCWTNVLVKYVCVCLLLTMFAASTHAEDQTTPHIRIGLVGDSTMTDKQGYGPGLAAQLNEQATLINYARGGRSSKSYRDEGSFDQVLKDKPDYILIQFGHNDEGKQKGPAIYTDPQTTYRDYMKGYITDARAAGIKPILVTCLCRRQFQSDGKIHSSLIPYVAVEKQLAEEMQVPLVHLHSRSIAVCEALGASVCELTFSPLKSPREPAGIDHTHLNPTGAILFGGIVADELKQAVPELQGYFITAPRAAKTDIPASTAATQPEPATP